MKTLKLAVVALSLGFFAASCGNETTTNEAGTDTTVVVPETAPPAEVTPAPTTDSPVVAPVATDSPVVAPAAH